MNFRQIRLLASTALLLLPVSLLAEDEKGGSAGSFWQVPLGARPAAMGGAYISVADDGAGTFYNPAGSGGIQHPLFGASYRFMQLDRSIGYVHGMFPVRGEAVIGFGWLYASSGKLTARDADGDPLGFDLGMDNHDFFITFAKRFEKYLSLGIRMSYLYSRFAEMSSSSVGFDVGSVLYLSQFFDREKRETMAIQDIQAGIVVRRIESNYRWNNEKYLFEHVGAEISNEQEDKVPLEGGLGLSARFLERKLLLSTDFVVKEKIGPRFHAGAEYLIASQFALRGGFSDGSLTTGAGYVFKVKDRNFAIDYAFITDKADEGLEHLFSIDLQF